MRVIIIAEPQDERIPPRYAEDALRGSLRAEHVKEIEIKIGDTTYHLLEVAGKLRIQEAEERSIIAAYTANNTIEVWPESLT